MSFVDADILKTVVGSVASGPAGFGVNYEVTGGGAMNGDTVSVDVNLNRESLDNAKGQLEHGNKDVVKTLEPPKPSTSMNAIMDRRTKADNKYGALMSSVGLSSTAERGLTKGAWQHRPDYRAALTPKNPLMRIRQRQLLQLRKTFDEISRTTKKTVTVSAESLPQHLLGKMAEAALKKGQQVSGASAKAAGYNHTEWSRWGHSLIAGSVIPIQSPRPS